MSKLKKLYLDLEKKTEKEYELITQDEIDPEKLDEIVMQKRVVRDKIEKLPSDLFSTENPKVIKNVIKRIIKLEKKNQEIYQRKMKNIKSKMQSIASEKKLKKIYGKSDLEAKFFDSKK
ncbi:MAG: hypothetical protein ACQERZ_03430 [Fusobacteriota bacterium]